MASGDGDGTRGKSNNVWIWNFQAGTRKTRIQEVQNTHVLRGHEGAVRALSFGPNGHLLCSASDDETARIWKVGYPPPLSKGETENARMAAAKEMEKMGKEGKFVDEPPPERTTKATYRQRMRAQQASSNPIKDFVNEVQEQWWEFVLQDEIGESGTQAHKHTGPARRVNGGHENVYGWVDDESSKKSPRGGGITDGCAQS